MLDLNHMPVVAEKCISTEQDVVAPDQNEEAETRRQLLCNTNDAFTTSSFTKTLRSSSFLQALELPATFVKKHGHNFQATVFLQGPSGRSTEVRLSIKSYPLQDRVHFGGAGWRAFVQENEFQVGNQLLFSLVSMSTFTARLVSASSSAVAAPPAKTKQQPPHGLTQPQPQPHSSSIVPTSSSYYNVCYPGIMHPPSGSPSAKSNVKNDVVYANNGTLQFKREVETRLEHLRCPHFVTTIGKSNLREHRSCTLNVPTEFQRKYREYLTKLNFFEGPAQGRVVEVWLSGTKCERFSKGWKAFHKENGIKLGDVVLFSLRAPAWWLVQVVGNSRPEERTIGNDSCDNNSSSD